MAHTQKVISLQIQEQEPHPTRKKSRSAWEKEGKFKYLNRKLTDMRKEFRSTMRRIETQLQVLTRSMQPSMTFEPDYIVQVVCRDERDMALFDYLISKGDLGIAPTEACIVEELKGFKFKKFQVTRRLQRMNKRLQNELNKNVADSHGRRWVVTNFVLKAWSSGKDELEEQTETDT